MTKDINQLIITRANPLFIIFMLDTSGSMSEKFGNANMSKAEALSNSINKVLYEIGLKSMKDGELISRFEIAIFSYGDNIVTSGWQGDLANRNGEPAFNHTIKNIFEHPLKIYDDERIEWITPCANGNTPMLAAFKNVYEIVDDWINWGNHKNVCHPPIIINITDGVATDDDVNFSGIKRIANNLKKLATEYGEAMIMNIHISGEKYDKILFPNKRIGDDQYQRLLFEISSPLYNRIINKAREVGYKLKDDAKGYIYNGDSSNLLDFLNIGTQGVHSVKPDF